MAEYEYTARDRSGDQVTGVIQAENEPAVARALDEQKLYPISIAPAKIVHHHSGGRVKLADLSIMYGQFSDLLRSGVPMMRSLDTLQRAFSKGALGRILQQIRQGVADGQSLADAAAPHDNVFTPLHIAMIKAGERGGFLEDVLSNLGDYIDRVDDLRNKVRGALIYPALLVVLGITSVLVVLLALVPKFKTVFGQLTNMPTPTKVMFGLSDLLIAYWPSVLAAIALVAMAIAGFLKSQAGRELWAAWQIRLPVVGAMIRSICVGRFCRILGTLLASGVPILQALGIAKDAAGSAILAKSIEKASDSVREGQKLAEPLRQAGLFPPGIIEMIAVAEESNQMEKTLLQVANNVERRSARQVDAMVRLVEPLILVCIAAAIGFVAMGLLYPIFTMSRTLR